MSAHKALCAVVRQPDGARTMVGLVGGNHCNVATAALGALSQELLMLSHYCGVAKEGDAARGETALGFLEDVLLNMSERTNAASKVAAAELAVASEHVGTAEAAE